LLSNSWNFVLEDRKSLITAPPEETIAPSYKTADLESATFETHDWVALADNRSKQVAMQGEIIFTFAERARQIIHGSRSYAPLISC